VNGRNSPRGRPRSRVVAKDRGADGRQVKAASGEKPKAQRELGKLLDAVEKGWQKPERTTSRGVRAPDHERPLFAGAFLLPGLDSNQQPSG
jgi:hypothetical protein